LDIRHPSKKRRKETRRKKAKRVHESTVANSALMMREFSGLPFKRKKERKKPITWEAIMICNSHCHGVLGFCTEVDCNQSTAAEQHLKHVSRAVGQQTGISAYHWKTELGCSN